MIREQVIRIATAEPRGFARLDLCRAGGMRGVAEAAATFRELGFVCVKTMTVVGREEKGAALARRHAAVFVLDANDLGAAADAVAAIARADGRRRVLVHAVPLPSTRAAPTPQWSERQHRLAASLGELIVLLEIAGAIDVLSGVEVEAACRGMPVDPCVALRRVQSLYWLGRHEEASRALRPARGAPDYDRWCALVAWARGEPAGRTAMEDSCLAPATDAVTRIAMEAVRIEMSRCDGFRCARRVAVLRRGPPLAAALADRLERTADSACPESASGQVSPGLERFGEGRRAMNVLHAMPRLLQVVHDTEDEGVILRRACAWLTDHAGATGAAILARDDLRIVAGQGIDSGDVLQSHAAEVLRTGVARTDVAGPLVTCVPVRYATSAIGVVLARGEAARAETLVEAATVVASLVGMALRARLDALALAGRGEALARDILGESLAMAELRESIARAAGSSFPVLIEGESGTGKELVASALHRLSARRDRRLCAVNCAALTDDLIEAEMFGHTRGAFTGAVGARPGLFEEAHRSSLFLDEVAELSPRGQAKLLRVLQEREIRRLGENAPRAVDVRIIGATNLPLAEAVALGRFREDLRFRLAVIRLRVPPLRERIEDVPLLARAFWRRLSADTQTHASLGADAVASLCRHAWPGNVRELQNVISALVVSAPTRGTVTSRHVAAALGAAGSEIAPSVRLDAAMRGFERRVVAAALARHGGRRTGAARELGLTRQGLTKAIRRLGLHQRDTERAGVA